MKIPLYSQSGEKTGEVAVSEKIFGHKVNKALIHKILLLQLANKRHPIAHTLTKGEVRGGGKKPFKQKHTGQARQGSITNPHNRGGGVAFGPRNVRNFILRAPKKERRGALFGVLSEKLKDGLVSALDNYTTEKPKTKLFVEMLKKLPFKKTVLFIMPEKNASILKSCRNIENVKPLLVSNLNIADLMKYQDILFLKDSIAKLEKTYLK